MRPTDPVAEKAAGFIMAAFNHPNHPGHFALAAGFYACVGGGTAGAGSGGFGGYRVGGLFYGLGPNGGGYRAAGGDAGFADSHCRAGPGFVGGYGVSAGLHGFYADYRAVGGCVWLCPGLSGGVGGLLRWQRVGGLVRQPGGDDCGAGGAGHRGGGGGAHRYGRGGGGFAAGTPGVGLGLGGRGGRGGVDAGAGLWRGHCGMGELALAVLAESAAGGATIAGSAVDGAAAG